jgi:hypothetical protein
MSHKRNRSCAVCGLHNMQQQQHLTSPSFVKAREWWLPHATSITSLPDKFAPIGVGNKHWFDEPFPSSQYPLWPQEYTSPVSVKAITCGPLPYAKPEKWIYCWNCCMWVHSVCTICKLKCKIKFLQIYNSLINTRHADNVYFQYKEKFQD